MNLYKNQKLLAAFDIYIRQQDALLASDAEVSAVTLSPALQWRMEKLLTRRKQGYYYFFGTMGRRVASVVIALLIAATTVTVSVEALREKAAEFFTAVFEKYTQVVFADDIPQMTALEPKMPTYIPEGYALVNEEYVNDIHSTGYTNDEGEQFHIEQSKRGSTIGVNSENAQYTKITINNILGITYKQNGYTTILFSDGIYQYLLYGTCPSEELIRIAESIS